MTSNPKEEMTLAPYDPNDSNDLVQMELALPGDDALVSDISQASASGMFGTDYTAEDVRIPRIRLAQQLTPEVVDGTAKSGQWIDHQGVAHDALEVTLIGTRETRTRAVGDFGNQVVLCRAGAPVGSPLVGEGDPGGPCRVCPFAEWTKGEDGKSVQPECKQAYEYLVQMGDGTLATFLVRGSSLGMARRLNAAHAQRRGQPMVITLTSEAARSGRYRYSVPVFSVK